MSSTSKVFSIPLPVTEVARSTIAPGKEPRPDLPPPFKPRSVNVPREYLLSARSIEPFTLLPRIFIPIPQALWKPPVMRYGWPAPRQGLLAYAKKHNLVLMLCRRNAKLSPDESDAESDTSMGDDSEDGPNPAATQSDNDSDDSSSSKGDSQSDGTHTVIGARTTRSKQRKPYPLIIITDALRKSVDQLATMLGVLDHILDRLSEEHDLRFPSRTIGIRPTLQRGDGERQIVTLYTNYDLLRKDLPSVEQIKTFGDALGVTMPPKWYIDEEQCEWRSIHNPYRR